MQNFCNLYKITRLQEKSLRTTSATFEYSSDASNKYIVRLSCKQMCILLAKSIPVRKQSCAILVMNNVHYMRASCILHRVGQDHIYTVHIRYFWQGNRQIYGHIRRIYTVLANPNLTCKRPATLSFRPVCVCACSRYFEGYEWSL